MTVNHRTHRGRTYSWDTNFEGVIANLERRYKTTESDYSRSQIERYMSARPCRSCGGKRLRPEALSVRVCGLGIMDVCAKNIGAAAEWVEQIDPDSELNLNGVSAMAAQNGNGSAGSNGHRNGRRNGAKNGRKAVPKNGAADPQVLSTRDKTIANQVLKEIDGRLKFLIGIGLDYVTMDRTAQTLSGGEAQRVRLATQIGSGLTGVLYVCDEPTVGLHPHDDQRLINTLSRLRDMGNTVLVVEHDEAMMRSADFIADLGPRAGEHGGQVVAVGTVEEIERSEESLTGQYLSGRKQVPMPEARREGNGLSLTVTGARENNLQGIDVDFPLGRLVCITGVSGSGKSSLVYEILYKKLNQRINNGRDLPGDHDDLLGVEGVDKVVKIDQSPIGRTPRSNPATYTGAFTPIRELFSNLPESRVRGYKPGRFSFNVKGGRCEACQGEGYNQIEMQFLPDVTVPCEICHGLRYNREALEVTMRGKHIAAVLNMTVDTALEFFLNFPRIRPKLETLRDVGLGYIRLGQPATTLSGGEGAAGEAGDRAVEAGHGQDGVSAGRAHDGAVVRGLRGAAGRASPAGGLGEHGDPHRAQHRRDEERRLADRPGARRRRQGRAAHRHGYAGGAGDTPEQRDCAVPEGGTGGPGVRGRRRGDGGGGAGGGAVGPAGQLCE